VIKKYKYLIANLLLLIPAIIVIYTAAYNYVNKDVKKLEHKAQTLIEMQLMYALVSNQQKIRGLSNIEELSIEVLDNIKLLRKDNQLIVKELQRDDVLKILQRHDMGTVADFDSYTKDIEDLLLLYKLTAYKAQITFVSSTDEYLLANTVTEKLPYLAEYFARVRGLASTATQHHLKRETKIEIENQLYMINELLKSFQDIKYISQDNSDFINELITTQQKAITFVEKEILNKKSLTLSALEIFDTLTQNIEHINYFYYYNIAKLENIYYERMDTKNLIKIFIIIIAFGSIIVVLIINLFYFHQIQKYIQKVEQLNLTDPMTGLYNRRFLDKIANALEGQTDRDKTSYALLMIDVDFFKSVNDTYGHDVGDRVIVAVAKTLQENIRKSDLAIRYGGEEFLLLLHHSHREGALLVANNIKNAFSTLSFKTKENKIFSKTLSIGISYLPQQSENIWECIKYADTALYIAKTTGRNKIVEYSDNLNATIEESLS